MRLRLLGAFLVSVLFAAVAAAQSADLYVIKSGPATATEGSNITFTVTVGNGGPDDASSAMLTDTLPSTGTFVSENQTGGPTFTCTTPNVGDTGGTVSCTIATLAAGESATFQITIAAPVGTAGTTLINSASITSDTPDDNGENNTSFAGTDIAGGDLADVGILKTGPSAAPPDSDVSYTITVTNHGPNDANNVSFTDTLPSSVPGSNPMTFVSFNQTGGPTFNCGNPGSTTTCSIATFPNGSIATFTLVGHIPNAATSGMTFTNVASLTSANDPNSENDTSATTVSVSTADVGVNKSAPATAVAGGQFSYTITLSNGGPDTASNASFNDPLPPGINFVSVVQNTGTAAACSNPSPNVVLCTIPQFGSLASAQFTITVTSDPATANGTIVTNTVTATSDSYDSNPNNNSSSAATTINTNADIAVVKSGPANATPGVAFAYAITVGNNGPSNATSVNWVDILPAGTTFVSLNQTSGPIFNCTTGATVTCSAASMAPSTSAQFTLTVLPAASATGALSNTVNAASATTDTNPNNNSSTAPTTLVPSADLGVLKTGPVTGNVGQQMAFTITVTNGGPSNAANVTLTDALPSSLTFVSTNQTTGTPFACSGTTTVTCTAATMAPGTATFTLTTTINSPGTFSNTANVSSTTTDPNSANNSSTQPFSTLPVADLAVTKTTATVASSGANLSYTITVTNNGPSPAASVVLTDVIPANTTFVSMNQTGGTPAFNCSGTTTVTCTAATMSSGQSATFNLTVLVNMGPSVVNTATVSSATLDLTPANNSATATTPVAFGGNVPTLSPFALALLALALALIALKR